jgi:carbamoyl-phosphate synthase large subunit
LGGRGMEIVYDNNDLKTYVAKAALVSGEHPILIDDFLEDAFEFDVDALCDGKEVYIAGIMQHIEEAGIHSGDSACVLPAYELSVSHRDIIENHTKDLAIKLNTIGLINIQFAIKDNQVSVLEVNPRASRTVPFVSKVTDIPLAKIAAQLGVNHKLKDYDLTQKSNNNLIAVKKPVFPFNKFPDQSIFLSPEMKSTGEVIGLDTHLGSAYAKAEFGAGNSIPLKGTIFISVNDIDKMKVIPIARDFYELGYSIIATEGTYNLLNQNGIDCDMISKVGESRPNVVDYIKNKDVQFIINTPLGQKSRYDEYEIGKSAIRYKIPNTTTISGAQAALRAIRRIKNNKMNYRSLQEIFN